MIIYKFGGTSVGSAERMKNVAKLISEDPAQKIVVLSAVSGTTNSLVEIGELLQASDTQAALNSLESLKNFYDKLNNELFETKEHLDHGREVITKFFGQLFALGHIPGFNEGNHKTLLSFGELLSTNLFHIYLNEAGISNKLLPALDFMSIDIDAEPEIENISAKLSKLVDDHNIFITQGYICRNHLGQTDNLRRGGSDYSASIIGAATKASEVQVWTDIDGMHNNDPRIVDNTFPISNLTFDEAAELAYFGAKILHPSSILPAQKFGIPVRLKNTMTPEANGTLIGSNTGTNDIKAIAAKDGIIAIKIKSTRMLLAHGFLKSIFEVFGRYRTSIDMVTTSEVAVSLTVDDDQFLPQIKIDLERFGFVEIDKDQTIICIVGSMVSEKRGVLKKIFDALGDVPVRMVSYGGSRNNISLLINSQYKKDALVSLNDGLFN